MGIAASWGPPEGIAAVRGSDTERQERGRCGHPNPRGIAGWQRAEPPSPGLCVFAQLRRIWEAKKRARPLSKHVIIHESTPRRDVTELWATAKRCSEASPWQRWPPKPGSLLGGFPHPAPLLAGCPSPWRAACSAGATAAPRCARRPRGETGMEEGLCPTARATPSRTPAPSSPPGRAVPAAGRGAAAPRPRGPRTTSAPGSSWQPGERGRALAIGQPWWPRGK